MLVTAQAVTHVNVILGFGRPHLGDIPMAVFTSHPGVKMRLVVEMDKIRQVCDGHPYELWVVTGILLEIFQRGCIRRNIRMTADAFLAGRQPRIIVPVGSWVTIQAGDPICCVNVMWEREGLRGSRLGNYKSNPQGNKHDNDDDPSDDPEQFWFLL